MSASLVISEIMRSRGLYKLSASRLLEPRYLVPAVVGGGAGAYWLHNHLGHQTPGEKIEGFIRKHPLAVGATVGGLATGAVGAAALRKLLNRLREAETQVPEPQQVTPIKIQIGDQAMQVSGPQDLVGTKTAGPLWGLAKAYGELGKGTAQALGRGLKAVGGNVGRGARWVGSQGAKYTGMNQVEAEHKIYNQVRKDPALAKAYETLSSHMATRGIGPRVGLGKILINPGGVLGQQFSRAGRLGWDLEQLSDPKMVQRILHGADPAVSNALKTLQARGMGNATKYLKENAGQGWLVPAIFASSMAYPLVKGDPKARLAEPGTPGAAGNPLQVGAEGVGSWVGRNLSPSVGNWIQAHPYASTGLAGAGLAGAGLAGYQAFRGN